ncbi:MAG: hypothetical protein WDM79_09125 [Terricaulis sp.]
MLAAVALDGGAKIGEAARELDQVIKLHLLARFAKAWMIAVLLAALASRPVAWRWPLAERQIQTFSPRGRDGERLDAVEGGGVLDDFAVRVAKGEFRANAPARGCRVLNSFT